MRWPLMAVEREGLTGAAGGAIVKTDDLFWFHVTAGEPIRDIGIL